MTLPAHWQPSEAARIGAAEATTRQYHEPPAWDGGIHCAGGLLPGTRAFGLAIQAMFPSLILSPPQGYVCRANTADASMTSLHGTGRAVDLMVTPHGDVSRDGDAIANTILANAKALGVEEVIWSRTIWTSLRGTREYTGPDPHYNHVHVGLSPAAAQSFNASALPNTASASKVPAVVGGVVAGVLLLGAFVWRR